MEDYRSRHHTQYIEREKERVDIIDRTNKLEKLVEDVKTHTNMSQIKKTVNEMLETIDDKLDKQKLSQIGLGLVEAINANRFTVTDFNNQLHVLTSRDVHAIVKSILSLCGIDDTIEVQYEMDCSRDEEMARRMAVEPPVLRRRQTRPASARRRRGSQMAL